MPALRSLTVQATATCRPRLTERKLYRSALFERTFRHSTRMVRRHKAIIKPIRTAPRWITGRPKGIRIRTPVTGVRRLPTEFGLTDARLPSDPLASNPAFVDGMATIRGSASTLSNQARMVAVQRDIACGRVRGISVLLGDAPWRVPSATAAASSID